MNTQSRASLNQFLLGLSALIMAVSLVLGVALMLQNNGGGFFPDLGKALGLLLIGAGNLLSWMLNLFCWYRTRIRWLGIVLAIQSLPALFLAGWLAILGVDGFLESRASDQRSRLYQAIESDDVPALQQALAKCGERCQEFFSVQRTLMVASLHGSHQSARFLLENKPFSTKPVSASHDFYNARTDLYTCEGTYLSSLSALDLAVANQDMEMLKLLWPASDERTRQAALWTAARLDRLDMVMFMASLTSSSDKTQTGPVQDDQTAKSTVPLLRKNYRSEQETLLRAAASGAALNVGTWLLETRPLALSQSEIQHALTDLLAFAVDTETQRSITFARLLMQYGASIQSAKMQDEPALERAIRYRSSALSAMLLELGTDRSNLSEQDAAQLDELLEKPDRQRSYRQNNPGCVPP